MRVALRNGADADYLYDRGGRLTQPANFHSAWFSCGLTRSEGRRNLRSTSDGQGTPRWLSTAFDYTCDAGGNITETSQDLNGAEFVTPAPINRGKKAQNSLDLGGWKG